MFPGVLTTLLAKILPDKTHCKMPHMIWVSIKHFFSFLEINPIRRGGTMYHRGIFLSRTLERQMILNGNFVTFNIFFYGE